MSKRFSTLNWIFLLLLCAPLVVTTGCGKDKKGAGTAKSPTTVPYMHPDFRVAVVIRPQQLLKSKLLTSVTGKLPADPVAEMTKELREETGLDLNQIERVVLLSNAFMPSGGLGRETQKESESFEGLELDSDFSEGFGDSESSDPEGAPEETGTDPGNGASLPRSAITTGTVPVALQEDDGSGATGNININEADMFPKMEPFFCVVIDVSDGVDLATIAEKITKSKATAKAGDHTYYPYSKDDDGPSVCVLSKTTILLAEEPHMKKILATGNSESPLSKELANLESTNDISIVALVGDAIKDMGAEDSLEQLSKTPNPFIPAEITRNASLVKDIQAVSVAINLSGDTFLQVNMNTSSSEVAGKLTKELEDAKKKGQESLAAMPTEGNPIAELGNALVNGLSINNNQGRVSVALKMSQEDLQKAVDTAMQFATMFGPGPGDFGPPEADFDFPIPEEGSTDDDPGAAGEDPSVRKLPESTNRP
jgi:hypothetical protein